MRRLVAVFVALLVPALLAGQTLDSVRNYSSSKVTVDSTKLYYTKIVPQPYPVPGPTVMLTDTLYCDAAGACSKTKPSLNTGSPAPLPTLTLGLPVGRASLPVSQFGANGSAALRTTSWRYVKALVDSVKAVNGRVILVPDRSKCRTSANVFSLASCKAQIDSMKAVVDWPARIADGTIVAMMIVDEPDCASCWGGKAITKTDVDSLAAFVKRTMPGLPTLVRVVPTWWAVSAPPRYVDGAWAQWEGPLHAPSGNMTADSFAKLHGSAAAARKLKLVLGINALDGGDGSSGIAGTYDLRTVSTRWQMSAAEVERVGTAFVSGGYACAVIAWRWSPDYPADSYLTAAQLAGIRAFDGRADVQSAWTKVSALAKAQPVRSCAKP